MKYRSLALLSTLVLSAGLTACSSSGGSSDGAADGRAALPPPLRCAPPTTGATLWTCHAPNWP
ncbi:hypothetical protein [Streptomyces sp. NPDC059906]|uniref:hypothetical protein n=1 Tax=Streptomyces sp. NPDC059906 TaxID=3346997 RepID=UPI00365EDF91